MKVYSLISTLEDWNLFSFKNFIKANHQKNFSFPVDDRAVVWNPIFKSIFRLYQKLKSLGFTYFEGKVTIKDVEEERSIIEK